MHITDIEISFSFSVEHLKHFLRDMRTQFSKLIKGEASGAGAKPTTDRKQWILRRFEFLRNHIQARRTGRTNRKVGIPLHMIKLITNINIYKVQIFYLHIESLYYTPFWGSNTLSVAQYITTVLGHHWCSRINLCKFWHFTTVCTYFRSGGRAPYLGLNISQQS